MAKIVLGITGSFGTGKTTVSRLFRKLGAEVINADNLCHDFLNRATQRKKILKIFGTINRKKLANIVFQDYSLLKKLEKILHPCVIGQIKKNIKNTKQKIIVIDAPLLIESGLNKFIDKLITVKTNQNNQIKRIIKKSAFTQNEIIRRVKMQMPLSEKIKLADYIIDNNGTILNTEKQVKKIWEKLRG